MSRLAPRSTPRVGSFRSRILGLAREPAGDDDLLLVAAGERGDPVARATELDPQPVDVAREPSPLEPSRRRPARVRGRWSAARSSRGSRATRTATRRAARGARRRCRRGPRAAGESTSAVRPSDRGARDPSRPPPAARAGIRPGPWPSSPASPTISPARSSKSIAAPSGAAARPRRASTTSLGAARSGCGVRRCPVRCSAPVISRTSSRCRRLAAASRRDRLAGAHHGDAVADLLDLVHPVRDEDRARALLAQVGARSRTAGRASRRRAPTSPRRGSGSAGSPHERPRDAARLPVAQGQLPRPAGSRSGADRRELAERRRGALDPLLLRHGMPVQQASIPSQSVVEDRAGGDDEHLLEDRDDPDGRAPPAASGWPRRRDRRPRSSRVGAVDPREHLHERALARPVLAHDRVHLAHKEIEGAGGAAPASGRTPWRGRPSGARTSRPCRRHRAVGGCSRGSSR